ncbi:HNH endonuclease [Streptomyces sp. NBC_01336]|uniref:HNH endonuclease n=1 Tax=Streptomyces sp. NBC_01336 TaxID=2903829 RepID=UPI002E0EF948|nr:HNH endonuclease [Streptomyces sp. NBC_01336]
MATAWLVLAVGDNRKHGGNGGYDDLPSEHYSWDSSVPHHSEIAVGDVIAVWDKVTLLGTSVIESIQTGQAVKDVFRCPSCGKSDFQPRKTKRPKYVCLKCEAAFDVPVSATKPVTTYRSRHGAAWVDMPGVLSGAELRALCDKPRTQHSLRSMRWERLSEAIQATGATTTVTIAEQAQRAIAGGHRQTTVRARIGQAPFRRQLLETHGELCAFTGPAPAAVLEAAHLYSYADTGEHHSEGGLLLRRDVHRLFDLGLIACDPLTKTLDVASALVSYQDYFKLHGQPMKLQPSRGHLRWLSKHWDMHRSAT